MKFTLNRVEPKGWPTRSNLCLRWPDQKSNTKVLSLPISPKRRAHLGARDVYRRRTESQSEVLETHRLHLSCPLLQCDPAPPQLFEEEIGGNRVFGGPDAGFADGARDDHLCGDGGRARGIDARRSLPDALERLLDDRELPAKRARVTAVDALNEMRHKNTGEKLWRGLPMGIRCRSCRKRDGKRPR